VTSVPAHQNRAPWIPALSHILQLTDGGKPEHHAGSTQASSLQECPSRVMR